MKKLFIIMLLLSCYISGYAQCEERIEATSMKPGMYIFCTANDNATKKYVAQVLTVNGKSFTCRFAHSNSIYEFIDFKHNSKTSVSLMQATVKSSKGGGYKEGAVFTINVYMIDPQPCDLSKISDKDPTAIVATFTADNKSYFARTLKTQSGYDVYFPHSGATYSTDNNFKVLKNKGGGYIVGSKMTVVHARLLDFYVFTP